MFAQWSAGLKTTLLFNLLKKVDTLLNFRFEILFEGDDVCMIVASVDFQFHINVHNTIANFRYTSQFIVHHRSGYNNVGTQK